MSASRERILALAMLPVFVVGTLPQAACICADGHREAACPKLKGGGEKHVRSCCDSKSRERAGQPGPIDGIGSKGATCCRVMAEGPPATVVAKKSRATEDSFQVASGDCFVSHTADRSFRPVISHALHCQPPPKDAVILYSRLTI